MVRIGCNRVRQFSMKSAERKTIYKKAASGEKVNRWVCDKYEGYRGGNIPLLHAKFSLSTEYIKGFL